MAASIRLAVDIGGTFTDVALEQVPGGGDPARPLTTVAKVLTTHDAPERGVIDGATRVLERAGVAASAVTAMVYGTTLATNLLIERKGAPTGLLTTEGFRDSVEMRNESRYEQYDLDIELPAPLVPRRLRLGVPERISARGEVLIPLDTAAVAAAAETFRTAGVASVAIGFLHSYIDDRHERRAAEVLAEALPGVEISLSSEVSPEMREYERISTTCANAYVQPLMSSHLARLEAELGRIGITCPVFLMLSGGGITTLATARRFPVRLVESGPAGGAIFAGHIARQLGLGDVVSYDMGGTTAKLCLIDDGTPHTSRSFEVARIYRFMKGSGLPLRIPVIDMVEIGAGGGSLAHIDALGRIAVGPESAGSEPGPASYGRGGTGAAVTDADVLLGRIDPEDFAGGTMRLDTTAASAALDGVVGARLGLGPVDAALGVSEMVDENMANAARVHAIESGEIVEARTLIAFGGAAPLHAARIAEKLGVSRVIVPPGAGVGSALGFLRAPVAYEVTRSFHQRLSQLDGAACNTLLDMMRAEARSVVEPGAAGRPLVENRLAYMRYVGQGHEVGVELPVRIESARLDETSPDTLTAAFVKEYHRLYQRSIPHQEIEILSWVLSLGTEPDPVVMMPLDDLDGPDGGVAGDAPEPSGRRRLVDAATGETVDALVYQRSQLRSGHRVDGPAVIVETDTATVVSGRFSAAVHPLGHLVLTARAGAAAAPGSAALARIHQHVMWNRLIAVVEEQAQALVRTAFSTSVREAGDLAAAVFDRQGRMLAQAVTGTPGHINALASCVVHFLDAHPIDTMEPGDVFITNDPWLASGHQHDITVATPVFVNGRPVAVVANTCHVVDIGGRGFTPDGRQVYEEGLNIPILHLFRRGEVNDTLMAVVRMNVRESTQVVGDLYSFTAANDIAAQRLVAMMAEFGIDDLGPLADFIVSSSREATIERIRALPRGTFRNSLTMDGYERPVTLAAAVTVGDGTIHVDYTGTSPASNHGINLVLNYTKAYTTYGIKVAVAPDIPNNHGSIEVFTFYAPEGCIPTPPAP
ncbi:MAG: hydantoinase B/oxoprolinase family protein, partial [Acidimicrobiia bacterium]|nr:hydantoinase B/oxoprolinase family protein [Acidimicrobiia bacterium]